MFRRSFARLTRQTVKEPMGHEENTFARGKRSAAKSILHIQQFAVVTGVGCVLALYTFFSNHGRVYRCIDANGKMGKTSCPVMWWNY